MADENLPSVLQAPSPPPAATPEETRMHEQFRADMRRSGLVPYEWQGTILGVPFNCPAVNVRDCHAATRATTLHLLSDATPSGDFRMVPVLAPVTLP